MSAFVYSETCLESPPYLEPFEIERTFDYQSWGLWMNQYWHWSIYASIVYATSVFYGQIWMATQEPFRLKKLLILWNLILSLGSLLMFSRIWPELSYELKTQGVKHSVCNSDNHSVTTAMWIIIFTLSKIWEFGDTAFIVARKQNLMFLHWYHHITVAIYSFAHSSPFDPANRWFASINAFIHTIMYGYYALKAMEIKVPRHISKIITLMQILQMVVGIFVNVLSFYMKSNGERCDRTYSSMVWALLMYGSYLALFIRFFKSAYQKPSKPVGSVKKLN